EEEKSCVLLNEAKTVSFDHAWERLLHPMLLFVRFPWPFGSVHCISKTCVVVLHVLFHKSRPSVQATFFQALAPGGTTFGRSTFFAGLRGHFFGLIKIRSL